MKAGFLDCVDQDQLVLKAPYTNGAFLLSR